MQRRRNPSLWPWVIGLIVLALLIWAIAELVNTDRDNKTMAAADAGDDTTDSSAPPAPAASGVTAVAKAVAPVLHPAGVAPLGVLLPLGVQDVGQTVGAAGTVLSKPAHGGFWLRSDAKAVLWVKSAQKPRPGQQIGQLTGTLQQAPPGDMDAWLKDSGVQQQAAKHPDWQLTTGLYLDTEPARVAASSPGARRSGAAGARGAQSQRRGRG